MSHKISDLKGKKFTNWLVTGNRIVINAKSHWECTCDCGIKKTVSAADLQKGKTKRCFSCSTIYLNKQRRSTPLTNTFWNKIERNGKVRSLEFTITKEEAYELYLEQGGKCKYTNIPLLFPSSTTKSDGTASLDRIDNTKGYIKGNLQWVHKKVNQIKMDLEEKDFIFICHLVSENNIKPDQDRKSVV